MNASYGTDYDNNYFFVHQIFSVALSIAAFIVAFKFPYQKIRKIAKWVMYIGLGLCVILMILSWVGSSLASCQLGACRWISLGPLGSFQPSEMLKFGLVLYLAQMISEKKQNGKLGDIREFWVPFGILCIVSLIMVVVVQSDLGTGVTMITIILAMLFMSGIPMKQFWIVVGVIALAGILAIVTSPHRLERLMTFSGEESSDTYHIDNAMMAIGTGGIFGVGIGNSVQATGYLPESINDSVFAILGETFGLVGLLAIVICFTVLLFRLLKVSERAPDDEQGLVVVGVFAWIAAHLIVNIAAMTGLMPLTGITLPLLSYGGTSMIFISGALGLCLQISCYTSREVRKENESISSGRGLGGPHYTSRRRRP